MSHIVAAGVDEEGEATSTLYRYDSHNRLVLVRQLMAADNGTPYGYAQTNTRLGITSWTNQQTGCRTASVTVQSSLGLGLNAPASDSGSYIVIKQMSGAGVPSVDRSGGATHCLTGVVLKRDEWIVDLACVKPQEKDLGKITGLVVRV